VTNDEVRHLATQRVPSHVIKEAAMRGGMQTLRMDGWRKVLDGTTTLDEVVRVTKAD
jgi:general secretion pathway protein E/type IV pilus assembly protein PilB